MGKKETVTTTATATYPVKNGKEDRHQELITQAAKVRADLNFRYFKISQQLHKKSLEKQRSMLTELCQPIEIPAKYRWNRPQSADVGANIVRDVQKLWKKRRARSVSPDRCQWPRELIPKREPVLPWLPNKHIVAAVESIVKPVQEEVELVRKHKTPPSFLVTSRSRESTIIGSNNCTRPKKKKSNTNNRLPIIPSNNKIVEEEEKCKEKGKDEEELPQLCAWVSFEPPYGYQGISS